LALFLRYQTANDRAFHRCLGDLLKLRAEKRKAEIGFERKERERESAEIRLAAEKRKQDRHESDLMLAQAKADHQALTNMMLGHSHPHLRPFASAAADRIIAAATGKAA
ncbi:MAG: hypothetical protein ACRD4O_17490, partial [Bryobacteraceae bacterium]